MTKFERAIPIFLKYGKPQFKDDHEGKRMIEVDIDLISMLLCDCAAIERLGFYAYFVNSDMRFYSREMYGQADDANYHVEQVAGAR